MFLFENFTYDNDWASQYYDDFYDASPYLKQFLNDGFKDNGEFYVKQCYSKDHDKSKYMVGYIDKCHIFCDDAFGCFPYDAYVYAYNKLKKFGKAITIDSKCFPIKDRGNDQHNIIIHYDKELDEKRWNSEHKRYEDAFKSPEVLECIPTLEQWLYMIQAKFEKKNPNRFLSREKNLISAAQKYIISIKLGWDDAQLLLTDILSKILKGEVYGRYSDKFPRFIKILTAFARFEYEIDPTVQELIDSIKSADKNISTRNIPIKYLDIMKALDENELVRRYQFAEFYDNAFNIETVNGNIGRIYIDKVDSISGNFCQMTLHLKDMPTSADTKSAKYSFNYMPSIIPSAVKAIFKNDPQELNKITIKYNG